MFSIYLKNMFRKCFSTSTIIKRYSHAVRKRFYNNVTVCKSDSTNDDFYINLDEKHLKTPLGQVVQVKCPILAELVAQEWTSQEITIKQHRMYLTTLCSSVIDNPNKYTCEDLVERIVNYLDTDTILYQCGDEIQLYKLQCEKWDPLIRWFNERFQMNITKSEGIIHPSKLANEIHRDKLMQYLKSYNFAALNGILYAVESLKSSILVLGSLERVVTVPEAVELACLEEKYQSAQWGTIEWQHDLNEYELQARLAASVLFVYYSTYW